MDALFARSVASFAFVFSDVGVIVVVLCVCHCAGAGSIAKLLPAKTEKLDAGCRCACCTGQLFCTVLTTTLSTWLAM